MVRLKELRIRSTNGFVTIGDTETGESFYLDLRTAYRRFHNQEVFSVTYDSYGTLIRANIEENFLSDGYGEEDD